MSVGICNCTDCQMLTGSVFRVSVPTEPGTFRLLAGTPKEYLKTADSGNKRRHSFCPNCGTPVTSSADTDTSDTYALRVGCLEHKVELPPTRRIWRRSALPWAQNVDLMPWAEDASLVNGRRGR